MLAKGEVEEIIARPDLDIVTIKLYEGAIIKGRKVNINNQIKYIYLYLKPKIKKNLYLLEVKIVYLR